MLRFFHLSTGLAILLSVTGSLLAQSLPNVELVFEGAFGIEGSQPGQFFNPRGITVGERGQIIVADSGNDRIQICDDQGRCTAFGRRGERLGEFTNPHGVVVDSRGRIITLETYTARVQIFDSEGGFLGSFGGYGSRLAQFRVPGGLTVDSQDRIIIADELNNRIQICDD